MKGQKSKIKATPNPESARAQRPRYQGNPRGGNPTPNRTSETPEGQPGWQPPNPPVPQRAPQAADAQATDIPTRQLDDAVPNRGHNEPLFPDGVDLCNPPADLFARSARFTEYELRVRAQTVYLLELTLKVSTHAQSVSQRLAREYDAVGAGQKFGGHATIRPHALFP